MKEVIRHQYLEKLSLFRDRTDTVKVIIGARRSGKSVIMDQFKRGLLDSGTDAKNILYMNFESSDFGHIRTYAELNEHISDRLDRRNRAYVLLDEVQRVDGWERTVNSLMIDYDADIYITGSNAYLLSSELSTYISGRYVEIEVLPFSFKEFVQMNPATPEQDVSFRFNQYLTLGGMPLMDLSAPQQVNEMVLEGIYHTVLLKDVAIRAKIRDASALESVARFLFDNMKNITNIDNISSALDMNYRTVKKYIKALTEAFLFYKAERYDIIGKRILKTHEKYYSVDTGLAKVALDRGVRDLSGALENVVYLELRRRGYRIRVGSYKDKEVDFTAEKDGRIHYYQVCLTMLQDDTFKREVGSLDAIRDSHPKTILSLDTVMRPTPNGIEHRNVIQWLLE